MLSAAQKQAAINFAHNHAARVIVALGGSTFHDYQLGKGAEYGSAGALFAQQQLLDGVDFDMEGFTVGFGTPTGLNKQQSIAWLTDATNAARATLGADALITHAPQAPYFAATWANGYLDFFLQNPRPPVNAFLIQYYNQADGQVPSYLTYTSQFIRADDFKGTAVAELITRGIPAEFLVVGKLTQVTDGWGITWVSPQTIHTWAVTAPSDPQAHFWNTGFSTWQWHTTGSPSSQDWISTIYPPGSPSFFVDDCPRTVTTTRRPLS